jgi:thiol-disulfide isomerase/thioredoxin
MKYFLIGLGLLILILLGFRIFTKGEGVKIGNQAPEIQEKLIDGSEFALSDLQGKYVLLDFWGSWCAPCRRENPKLVALYNEFSTQNSEENKFEIVSIALEKRTGSAEQVIQKDNLNWKYHIISLSRIVLLSPLANQYNVTEVPSKYLINPDGKIIGINPTIEQLRTTLAKKLQ